MAIALCDKGSYPYPGWRQCPRALTVPLPPTGRVGPGVRSPNFLQAKTGMTGGRIRKCIPGFWKDHTGRVSCGIEFERKCAPHWPDTHG